MLNFFTLPCKMDYQIHILEYVKNLKDLAWKA